MESGQALLEYASGMMVKNFVVKLRVGWKRNGLPIVEAYSLKAFINTFPYLLRCFVPGEACSSDPAFFYQLFPGIRF